MCRNVNGIEPYMVIEGLPLRIAQLYHCILLFLLYS